MMVRTSDRDSATEPDKAVAPVAKPKSAAKGKPGRARKVSA